MHLQKEFSVKIETDTDGLTLKGKSFTEALFQVRGVVSMIVTTRHHNCNNPSPWSHTSHNDSHGSDVNAEGTDMYLGAGNEERWWRRGVPGVSSLWNAENALE